MTFVGFALPSGSVYWDYAMTIHLEEIVYLHCHQQGKRKIRSRVASATSFMVQSRSDERERERFKSLDDSAGRKAIVSPILLSVCLTAACAQTCLGRGSVRS